MRSLTEHRPETTHVGGVGSPSELVSADYKNAKLVAIWYRSWPIAFTSWLLLFRVEERIFIFLFFLLNCNLKFSENITQDKLYMNFFYMDIFLNLFWNFYL